MTPRMDDRFATDDTPPWFSADGGGLGLELLKGLSS